MAALVGEVVIPVFAEFNGKRFDVGTVTFELELIDGKIVVRNPEG